MKINTSDWEECKIGDLFEAERGEVGVLRNLADGDIPVIAASANNEGVAGYFDVEPKYKNRITVSCNGVGCGSSFFHNYPFNLNGDAVVLLEKTAMSQSVSIAIAAILNAFLSKKYSYAEKLSPDKIKDETILLPVDIEQLSGFMGAILLESKQTVENFESINYKEQPMDIEGWTGFRIDDLFEVVKGTRLTRADMLEGTTPFIGACITNNGISNRVGNTEHIHKGNLITVAYDGAVATGKAFYQPDPFWASDSVAVLYPRFDLNKNIALFLVPLIEKAGEKFHYDEKWTKPEMEQSIIYVPVTQNGSPDWNYMEEFMRKAVTESQTILDEFQTVLG